MCYNVMAGATAVWVPPPPLSLAVHACTFEHQSKQLLFVLAEGGLQAPGELSLLFKSWSEPESVVICFWYFFPARQTVNGAPDLQDMTGSERQLL